MKVIALEIIYIVAGCIALLTAYHALKDKQHSAPKSTALFWTLLAITFIFGKVLPNNVIGLIVVLMGVITATKRVKAGSQTNASDEERQANAQKIGNWIFIPALTIGLVAFFFAQFITSLGGLVGLGVGALIATIIAILMTKERPVQLAYEGSRLLQQIGAASILPQLLAALGALFAKAKVGEYISEVLAGVVPAGNLWTGVIIYCIGMALFTIIMGNAFAAFAVITAGVGLPFVLSQGADPATAGILALTAGYCGTLMTPMAANFNVVPAAILETKSKYRVILSQIPFAIILLIVHIVLMYFMAF